MMDLVILLSISLAVTALLGLLLIGFVSVPWLISIVLLVLLVALMKLTSAEDQQTLTSLAEMEDFGVQSGQSGQETVTDEEPVMVYRGAKYKRTSETPVSPASLETPTVIAQGKYRGQQWSR